jgi:hypothetical protein
MTITTIGALAYKMYTFYISADYLLFTVAAVLLVMAGDMLPEAFKVLRKRGVV